MPRQETFLLTLANRISIHAGAWLRIFEPQPRFVHRGKTYAVRGTGRRALDLLTDILLREPHRQIISFRPQIREVIRSTPPVLLSHILSKTTDITILRLTIWTLGKSIERYATKDILAHCDHPDPKVRREAVRALKRFSAWYELREIEANCEYADTRIQAAACQPQPFQQRLASFARVAHRHSVSSRPHKLIIAPRADISHGRRPKSQTQIRLVLRRIKHLIARARRRRRI